MRGTWSVCCQDPFCRGLRGKRNDRSMLSRVWNISLKSLVVSRAGWSLCTSHEGSLYCFWGRTFSDSSIPSFPHWSINEFLECKPCPERWWLILPTWVEKDGWCPLFCFRHKTDWVLGTRSKDLHRNAVLRRRLTWSTQWPWEHSVFSWTDLEAYLLQHSHLSVSHIHAFLPFALKVPFFPAPREIVGISTLFPGKNLPLP